MVVLVSDDDPVVAVAEDTGGPIKLPVLLSPGSEFVVKDSLRRVNLDPIVGTIRNQDVTFAGAANAPRPAKLSVLLSFHPEAEDRSPDVVVVAAGANFKSEGAVLDVAILDGDADGVISFDVRPPDDFVKSVLSVRNGVLDLTAFGIDDGNFDRIAPFLALLVQLVAKANNEPEMVQHKKL